MATLDDSPSLYLGQPWSIWADKLEGKHKEGSGVKSEQPRSKDDSNTMKLRIEDMPLFGLCPSRDEFFLVVCEHCKQVVKPQALKRHIEVRHCRGTKKSSPASAPQISPRLREEGHVPSTRHDTHGKTPPGPLKGGTKGSNSSKHRLSERSSNHTLPAVTVDIERMPSPIARQTSYPVSSNMFNRSNSGSKSSTNSTNGPMDDDSIINSRVAMQVGSPPGGGVTGMTAHKSPPHIGVFLHPKQLTERYSERSQRVSSDRERTHSERQDRLSSSEKSHSDKSHSSDRQGGHGSERSSHSSEKSSHSSEKSSHGSERSSHGSERSRDRSDRSHDKTHGSDRSPDRASSHSTDKSYHVTTATTTTTTAAATDGLFTVITQPSQSASSLRTAATVTTASHVAVTVASTLSTPVTTSSSPVSSKVSSKSKSNPNPKPNKCIPCKDREFDPNIHCGVIASDSLKPCTRSLTCKTHALSLRRAVQGRRKPFDDLLREHREAKEKMIIQKYAEKGLPVPPKMLPSKSRSSSSSSSSQHMNSSGSSSSQNSSKTEMTVAAKITSPRPSGGSQPPAASPSTPGNSHRTPILGSPPHIITSPVSTTTKITKPPMLPSPTPVNIVKEEPIPETCSRLSSEGEDDDDDERDDLPYRHIPYHPRPAAVNNFGSRLAGSGCFVFNRSTDLLRAAFMVAVEQHLHPPPHKKLCLESRLPQGSQITTNAKDPYEFPTAGDSGQFMGKAARTKHRTNSTSSASSPGASRSGKSRDGSGGRSPASSGSSSTLASSLNSSIGFTSAQTPKQANGAMGGPIKRKRPSSSSSPGSTTLGSPTSNMPGMTSLTGIPVSLASGNTNPISIAIPTGSLTVNLSSSTLSHLNVAKTGQLQQSHKNSLPKDLNIVVTNVDPSLMNGQLQGSTNLSGSSGGEVVKLQLNNLAERTSNAKRARLNANAGNQHLNSTMGMKLGGMDGNVFNVAHLSQMMLDSQGAMFAPMNISSMSHSGPSANSTSPGQLSPSLSPSPLFSSTASGWQPGDLSRGPPVSRQATGGLGVTSLGSTSPPHMSATSPLPNGVVSSPTGFKTLPINHVAGAMSVSPSSNHGAPSPNSLEASQPAGPRHQRGSSGSSRSSIGLQKAAASMQQVMVSVSGGTTGLSGATISLAGQPAGRLIPALYTGQMLAPNASAGAGHFSHIQIQPKQTVGNGQGKTVATGKLAMQPVSLTIPLMTQPAVAMAQPQSQTARLLLQGTPDDRHRHRHHDLQAQVQTSPS